VLVKVELILAPDDLILGPAEKVLLYGATLVFIEHSQKIRVARRVPDEHPV
jgi:hypothetical protein